MIEFISTYWWFILSSLGVLFAFFWIADKAEELESASLLLIVAAFAILLLLFLYSLAVQYG